MRNSEMRDTGSIVNERVAHLADRFQRQGWQVLRNPARADLPHAAWEARPQLVVSRGGRSRLVLVAPRDTLRVRDDLTALHQSLSALEGWELEVIGVDTGSSLDVPQESRQLNPAGIRELIQQAGKLLAEHQPQPAFILAWAALEASLNCQAEWETGGARQFPTTREVLTDSLRLGFLEYADWRRLTELQAIRNAITHGYTHDPIDGANIHELTLRARSNISQIPDSF